MTLNQPYYIEPREGEAHIDLNGCWEFGYFDTEQTEFTESLCAYKTTLPKSTYHSLHEAGVLPDPYFGTNSELYHWVDEKIWYYRKRFFLEEKARGKVAILCFDGVAYYCKVWVNGQLCGDHEGMFGGPACDVTDKLNYGEENEIIVEVKACNYGCKDSFISRDHVGVNTQIIPWNICRDEVTTNAHFVVMGIWNRVRLELLDSLHISRPYLYTQSISDNKATLHLEMQIADGRLKELQEYYSYKELCAYTNSYFAGMTGATLDKSVRIVTEISEPDTGNVVYYSEDDEPLLDYDNLRMKPEYYELQFFTKDVEIANPHLWYPNGMGDAYLYDVTISLYDGERLCDKQKLQTGIRTFTAAPTHGKKYRSRWENFLFSINGKEMFLKGMNWMPIDFLYAIEPSEYEWCLTLAKNAGIQLLRVWNGGGMQETDIFYQLCDKLGLMVWQDQLIANTKDTRSYPHRVLEAQLAYNTYRIRNHASLVLICGGNEFNPYSPENAASMFVQQRVAKELAPHVIYHYTTADKGSAHVYQDMEPVWYRHAYKALPFLAESGIHSFPGYATWKKVLSENEILTPLPDLTTEEFQKNFPELLNHFTEYDPERVPRMLSRASQIINLKGASLEEMCEASQVQAYEFYTLMIQSMRENYPTCGGVMPWVFKRHWTTAGIQVVDGLGQPGYPYYAVQNTYRAHQVIWDMSWLIIAPHETLPLDITVISEGNDSLQDSQICMRIYRPDLSVEKEMEVTVLGNQRHYSFGEFTPDDSYTNQCFLVSVELIRNGEIIAESTYFVKCTSMLEDKELYNSYRTNPVENLNFENGPWLKPTVQRARQAELSVKLLKTGMTENYRYYDIRIENCSDIPVYPVTVHFCKDAVRHFESNNFFLLKEGDCRMVRITTDNVECVEPSEIEVKAWNATTVHA